MPTESDFLREIAARPADAVLRLAYADWLDEQAEPTAALRAESIRIEAELRNLPVDSARSRELKPRRNELRWRPADQDWIAAMGYAVRYDRELPAAIEQLYAAFGVVPKPETIDGCPCCIDRKGTDVLLRKRLREITAEELASYASSAFLTVGDIADYLYFLPRILELSALETGWYPDPAITGRAIRSAKPESWTAAQRAALDDFLEAVIGSAMQSEDQADILDSWVCAIARMGFDVRPYLRLIATSPATVLAYFEENAADLPRQKLTNGFWELPCPGHTAVVDWFYSPEIARIPFDAYGVDLARD